MPTHGPHQDESSRTAIRRALDTQCRAVLIWAVRCHTGTVDPESRRPTSGWLGAAWSRLAALAGHHGMFGYLAHALRRSGVDLPGALGRELSDGSATAAARHLRFMVDLGNVATTLDGAGITWAGFKGPYLSELAHGGAHLRSYSDLDILVPPSELRATVDALLASGARPSVEDYDHIVARNKAEIHLHLPGGSLLDLHWDLINDGRRRRSFSVPGADALLERRRRVDLGGTQAWGLAEADAAVHVALHATGSGGGRLIWPLDVYETWSKLAGEESEVLDTARRWQARLPVSCALALVQDLAGDVPGPAAGFDIDGAWPQMTRTLWRWNSRPIDAPRQGMAGWPSRATLRSPMESLREMGTYAMEFQGRERRRLARAEQGIRSTIELEEFVDSIAQGWDGHGRPGAP